MSLDNLIAKRVVVKVKPSKPTTREFIPSRYFDVVCQNLGAIVLSYTVAIPEFEN